MTTTKPTLFKKSPADEITVAVRNRPNPSWRSAARSAPPTDAACVIPPPHRHNPRATPTGG